MNKTPKFWNVMIDGETAEIELYGDVWGSEVPKWYLEDVGDFDYISPQTFRQDLEAAKFAKEVVIKINSCGGDLYTGLAIHNELKALDAHKTVIVEGIAASAASVIAMAGDEVQMYPGSMLMIHGVSGLMMDWVTLEDLKKAAKSFDAAEKAIANIYADRTGKDTGTLRSMMTRETWMVGQEAVDQGFADTVLEEEGPKLAASADRKTLLVAGVHHDVSAFHIPDMIPSDKRIHPAKADENKTTNSVEKMEVKAMTLMELKEQSPELVEEIEANAAKAALESAKADLAEEMKGAVDEAVDNAVAAERARMMKIDEIASNINDADLIKEAKYGEEPMTAEQLAFEALKRQQAQGTAFLADMKADTEDSKVNDVNGAPNAGVDEDVPQESLEEVINKVVDTYLKLKGEKKDG